MTTPELKSKILKALDDRYDAGPHNAQAAHRKHHEGY